MRCGTCKCRQVFRRTPHLSPPFSRSPALLGAMMVFHGRCWAALDAAGAAAALAGSQTAVSWCAPPFRHLFSCAAALYVPHASAARGWWDSRSRRRRCWVVLWSWSAVSSGERRFDAKRPSRTHSRDRFEPFTRSSVVRAVGSKAHVVCWSSCHHTHRRLDLRLARLALARWL